MRLAEWLMTVTRRYFLYKKISPKNKAILITGCDSGFGHMLAQRMDKLGYFVFAGCLLPESDGAKKLLDSCSERLKVVPLNVTSDDSIQKAKAFVEQHLKQNDLWAIVNNAGISQSGEVDWTPVDEFRKVFEVNTFGMLQVTKTFLPFVKRCKGRIVNNTSICGRFICPGYVGYCMSKSAAVSFTTGLRVEMMKWGVKVSSIEAFFYSTPLTQAQATFDLMESTWNKASPDIRSEYGESYKMAFKESCRKVLARASHKVYEVLDCFEDAITAHEPLPSYFPCYLPEKFGLKFLFALPSAVTEMYQASLLAEGAKPEAVKKAKCANKVSAATPDFNECNDANIFP
ncbi:retinol dehydrogenase 16-like [Uloborus diversus]|uniref:retinol dehydrogenase 16-like n=1 Tax=Uloborus diversus TaxID=327109 RepID=UPI00240A0421|nr:retinol dehydrogenase 16-like [Uloborus diversus]